MHITRPEQMRPERQEPNGYHEFCAARRTVFRYLLSNDLSPADLAAEIAATVNGVGQLAVLARLEDGPR